MLTIKAKEDSTIDVVDGDFSLGERNTIKVIIEDDIIKNYIKTIGTDTCLKEDNLIPYGNFDTDNDIKNIDMSSVTENTTISLVSGCGVNHSRCVKCVTANESGSGKLRLTIDNTKLSIGTKYKFVGYINSNIDVLFEFIDTDNAQLDVEQTNDEWKKVTAEFNITDIDSFKILLSCNSAGFFYFDSLSMFKLTDEIIENSVDSIGFRINVLNPVQYVAYTDEIITYSNEDDEISVTLYFPSITCVDFQDNLLCNLDVYLTQPPKVKTLGDCYYPDEIEDLIYQSQEFILQGYIF